eukprot:PhM_4_TR319/c0_g1_i1/m.64396/K08869/ADCK, ABC1; aarF domain-containing kinase
MLRSLSTAACYSYCIARGLCQVGISSVHRKAILKTAAMAAASAAAAPSYSSSSSSTRTADPNDLAMRVFSEKFQRGVPVHMEPSILETTPSAVPSGSISRAALFGTLAVRLASDYYFGKREPESKTTLTPAGYDALVDAMCHMRGAALKLAQMLSLQDEELVPPIILNAFAKVRDSSTYMPKAQLQATLSREFGFDSNWQAKFGVDVFRDVPFAAASIGQVHYLTQRGKPLAMKVQFPGVRTSIASDVQNLRRLGAMQLLPSGLFVGRILDNMQKELTLECDYVNEALMHETYRRNILNDSVMSDYLSPIHLNVPRVIQELSTKNVLTAEFCDGQAVDKLAATLPQHTRDAIGRALIFLVMRELFSWRFMQTDPNYSNFLFDKNTDTLHLVDFGAARRYDADFVRTYHNIVKAGVEGDADTIIRESIHLKLLTGEENQAMLEAHCSSVMVIAKPFRTYGTFDFGRDSITAMLVPHVKVMIKNRICPPPMEVYSLHRRLSGAFLMCSRLGARVNVGHMWQNHFNTYIETPTDDAL